MENPENFSISPSQAKQLYEMLMDMLLRNPELFEQIPGVTEEQRKAYKRMRMNFLKKSEKEE